ncbi:MAG: methylenetetrahydrofolate reductase C-terminal domain-containing protein [Candidatus Thermoplasmatota archaeon]|nr:methylenetetrahydrofolate reductase C-terminal domain-containing protein [Candidatus Thermoplasmatota archaeon]
MIVTKQKDLESIICLIQKDPVFIVGCSQCATLCKTGGEDEIKKMVSILKVKNINVTGWVLLDPACHLLNDKRILKSYKDKIKKAKKVLVLACGNGVQTVAEIIDNAEVIPGLDTLFLGEIKSVKEFEKRCNLCGECIQYLFDGLCPISRCPKNMLNGPCGGSKNGKCEVSKDLDCIWEIIINKLDKKKKLFLLKRIVEPKDWSKSLVMKR